MSKKDAEGKLNTAGLVAKLERTEYGLDKSKDGKVTAQNPVSGSSLNEGDEVLITIYEFNGAIVPSIVGKNESTAKSSLENVGLKVGNISKRSDSSKSSGTVLAQSNDGGSVVEPGSSVNLVICDNTKKDYYCYQNIQSTSKTTTTSSESPGTGYTLVDTKTETVEDGMGDWSNWSETYHDGDKTESKVQLMAGRYYHESDYNVGSSTYGGYGCTLSESDWFDRDFLNGCSSVTKNSDYGCQITTYYMTRNGYSYIGMVHSWGQSGPWHDERTLYRYKNKKYKKKTTYYWEKPVYTNWTSWSETKVTKTANNRVSKITIYWDDSPTNYDPERYVQ